jgi:FKBP-type peptidyl-prolyl cis-trans isomerase (trigger factor)
MVADLMSASKKTEINSKRESARLYLGELLELAEELARRNAALRNDRREIFDAILTRLESYCMDEDVPSTLSERERRRVFTEARRDLRANWIRVDTLMDDLLSSAADELSQFAAEVEARISACERIVRHRETNQG